MDVETVGDGSVVWRYLMSDAMAITYQDPEQVFRIVMDELRFNIEKSITDGPYLPATPIRIDSYFDIDTNTHVTTAYVKVWDTELSLAFAVNHWKKEK